MNAIKNFLRKVVSFFSSPDAEAKVNRALTTAYDVMQQALPVVEVIAALTPTRADDEIIALIKKFAVPLPIPPGRCLMWKRLCT